MAFKATSLLILVNLIVISSLSCHNVSACPPKVPSILPPSVPNQGAKCPQDTLKFGVCGSWLGVVHEVVGTKPSKECCSLIKGVADLEAALCLCAAIKSNVLGIVKLELPVAITLLLSACEKKVPQGFQCA